MRGQWFESGTTVVRKWYESGTGVVRECYESGARGLGEAFWMSILRRARVLDHHNALADHHSARTAEEMKLINALNLPAALQNPPGTITAGRKSCQRRSLASVNELRRAVFPGMRSKDSKLEPQLVTRSNRRHLFCVMHLSPLP